MITDFIKYSISYAYLYSPISWLHKQNSQGKIYIVLIQLIFLPYISFKYLYLFFILFICLYLSINIPENFKNYFNITIIILSFFLFISVRYNNLEDYNTVHTRKIIRIDSLYNLSIFNKNNSQYDLYSVGFFYIPVSILRLLGINFIYLFLIKFLLLTTHYEKIIRIILHDTNYLTNFPIKKINFEIMISSQFLKVILKQLETIKIAYVIRNLAFNLRFKQNKFTYLFFFHQLLINIYLNIYHISNTLYSREISHKNLNMMTR